MHKDSYLRIQWPRACMVRLDIGPSAASPDLRAAQKDARSLV